MLRPYECYAPTNVTPVLSKQSVAIRNSPVALVVHIAEVTHV